MKSFRNQYHRRVFKQKKALVYYIPKSCFQNNIFLSPTRIYQAQLCFESKLQGLTFD